MTRIKLIFAIGCLSLFLLGSASAEAGWRYRNGYYRGYGPPVYDYGRVVVPPPPVVAGPVYTYPATAYPPAVVPMYGPPVYGYGVVGRRGMVIGGPGVGVYFGR